jgi:hypothetical protein
MTRVAVAWSTSGSGREPARVLSGPEGHKRLLVGTMDRSNNVKQCIQTKDSDSNALAGVLAYKRFFLPSERLDALPFSPIIGCGTGSVAVDPKSTSLNPVPSVGPSAAASAVERHPLERWLASANTRGSGGLRE